MEHGGRSTNVRHSSKQANRASIVISTGADVAFLVSSFHDFREGVWVVGVCFCALLCRKVIFIVTIKARPAAQCQRVSSLLI